MKKGWLKYMVIYGMAGLSGFVLLQTSQNVQHAEDRLSALRSELASEREGLRVFEAEWAYLNRPENLEALSAKYLGLVPPVPGDMVQDAGALPMPKNLRGAQNISHVFTAKEIAKPSSKPAIPQKRFQQLLGELEKGGGR